MAIDGTTVILDTQPLHAGLATLSAGEIIKYLKITPIELVDILNGYGVPIGEGNRYVKSKRLVTIDEEVFREYANSGLNEKFFNIKSLEEVKIYQRDLDSYCEEWGIQKQEKPELADASEIEGQLAKAQKLNDSLRQCNKRLNEINTEKRAALEEKDARIGELEKELAAAKEFTASPACDGKGLLAVVCRMRREKKTDEEIASYLYDDGTWCSQAQVGALLRADETRTVRGSMNQCARRLLGKA